MIIGFFYKRMFNICLFKKKIVKRMEWFDLFIRNEDMYIYVGCEILFLMWY